MFWSEVGSEFCSKIAACWCVAKFLNYDDSHHNSKISNYLFILNFRSTSWMLHIVYFLRQPCILGKILCFIRIFRCPLFHISSDVMILQTSRTAEKSLDKFQEVLWSLYYLGNFYCIPIFNVFCGWFSEINLSWALIGF